MRSALLAIFVGLMTIGCGAANKRASAPLAVTEFITRQTYYSGTPLTGPTSRPVSISEQAEKQPVIMVKFVVLKEMPVGIGQSLSGALSTLVTDTQNGDPVLAAARLTAGARWVPFNEGQTLTQALKLKQAADAYEVGGDRALLLANVVTVATFRAPADRRVGIHLSPDDDGKQVKLGLSVQDYIPPQASFELGDVPPLANGSAPAGKQPPALTREMVILRMPWPEKPERFAIVVPLRLDAGPSQPQALAIVIDLAPGSDDPDHQQLLAAAEKAVRDSIAETASPPGAPGMGVSTDTAINAALATLSDLPRRRAALAFVCGQVDAFLCEMAALSADEDALGKLIATLQKALADAPPLAVDQSLPPETVSWILDRATFQWLARMRADGHLPPEMAAVLESFAGEAARQSSSLDELTGHMATRQEFQVHLTSENLVFLEDPSPGARVRAYDWLKRRAEAPAGYDPLAPVRERRMALDRALFGDAGTTAPSAPAVAPASAPATMPGEQP